MSTTAEIERQLVEIDEFEARWSTAGRKARKADLDRQLRAAVAQEVAERGTAVREYEELAATLEPLYEELAAAVRQTNELFAQIADLRGQVKQAHRRCLQLGAEGAQPLPATLAMRGVADRSLTQQLQLLGGWGMHI